MGKIIYWGFIGCGDVVLRKSGAAFFIRNKSAVLAIMRRNISKTEDFARKYKVPLLSNKAEDIIHHPEIDAVYIATPPHLHAPYAIECLKAGKAVYIEKPMALNYKESLEILDAAKAANKPVYVAYYRRKMPRYLKIKELLDHGQIGEVLTVNMEIYRQIPDSLYAGNTWRVQPEIAGGGYFVDLGSHQLDYMDFLFGKWQKVYAVASNRAAVYDAEDTMSALIEYPRQVRLTAQWCFATKDTVRIDRTTILGTHGRIEFPFFNENPVCYYANNIEKKYEFIRPDPVQKNMIEDIVDQLSGISPLNTNAVSASNTSQLLEIMLEDYNNKRKPDPAVS